MSKRTLCLPNTQLGIILLSISLLATLCLLSLIGCGFLNTIKNKSLPMLFKILYWITCELLLIAAMLWSIAFLFNFKFSGHCQHFNQIKLLLTVASCSYILSLICISALYLTRLYFSFKESLYSISKFILMPLLCGLLMQLILFCIYHYTYNQFLIAFKTQSGNLEKQKRLFNLVFQLFFVINISYNVIILGIFSMKVYQLRQQTPDLGSRKKDLIHYVTMYILCLCLAIFSTLIQSLFVWVRSDVKIDSNELYMFHVVCILWDLFINLFSINLQFTYSKLPICCAVTKHKNSGQTDIDANERIELQTVRTTTAGDDTSLTDSSQNTANGDSDGDLLPRLNRSVTSKEHKSRTI
eukprot:72956_1